MEEIKDHEREDSTPSDQDGTDRNNNHKGGYQGISLDTIQDTSASLPSNSLKYEDEDDLPFPPGGVSKAFDKGSSSEKEEDEEDEYGDHKIVLDTFYLIGKGSFLPATLLINNNIINPQTLVIDKNTGSYIAHYAAHHGNLKFIRWYVQKYGPSHCATLRDNYQCTLLHYAVRQGHLPVLMYLEQNCKMDLNQKDQFGYSVLEYAMVYKKVFCMLYITEKCQFTKVNVSLINKVVDTLLTNDDALSIKITQLIVRNEQLKKQIGAVLLASAVKHSRLDVFEDVYENCVYLPRLAANDNSTANLSQCIT